MKAMESDFTDLREEDSYRSMWIETTGTIDLRELADHFIREMGL